jgi:hypothetical protein
MANTSNLARPGAQSSLAKLTEHDVSEIRRAIAAGFGVNDLAAHFGVHRRTVSRIAAGLTWREPETALFEPLERFIAHTCYPTSH